MVNEHDDDDNMWLIVEFLTTTVFDAEFFFRVKKIIAIDSVKLNYGYGSSINNCYMMTNLIAAVAAATTMLCPYFIIIITTTSTMMMTIE